ncbi:carbonic anhydrase [bacterium]|nr:carbonic anhydrase [bacterium]
MSESAGPTAWQAALGRLRAGNERYQALRLAHPHLDLDRRAELRAGQSPFAAVLGCADSRVPPELIFDPRLGDLFVVRVAGHALDGAVLGSLEFAVERLGVRLVLVLGHESCGAVGVALAGERPGGQLGDLIRGLAPVIAAAAARGELPRDPAARLAAAARANARAVAALLERRWPEPARPAGAGPLRVLPAYYHLDSGAVEFLDPER